MTAMKLMIFTPPPKRLTAQEIMIHSHIAPVPLLLQTHYIRNIAVVSKVSCFIFISLGKCHPLQSSFQENDPSVFCELLGRNFLCTHH